MADQTTGEPQNPFDAESSTDVEVAALGGNLGRIIKGVTGSKVDRLQQHTRAFETRKEKPKRKPGDRQEQAEPGDAAEATGQTAENAPPPAGEPGSPEADPTVRDAASPAEPIRDPANPASAPQLTPDGQPETVAGATTTDRLAVDPATPRVEAEDLLGARLDQFNTNRIEQINFNTMQTSDDVIALQAKLSDALKAEIDAERRGVITDEQLLTLATESGQSTATLRKVLTRETGQSINPEDVIAARMILVQSAERLHRLATKITEGQAIPAEQLEFRRQLIFHQEYSAKFMGARAEVGRALRAFGINLEGAGPVEIDAMLQNADTLFGGDMLKMAQHITTLDSTAQIGKYAREYKGSRVLGVIQEVFLGSILSGIKTAVVNVAGNAIYIPMQATELAVAARVGRMLNAEERVLAGEASAYMMGIASGMQDAMVLAWRAMKRGENLDFNTRTPGIRKAISADAWNLTGPLGWSVDLLGAVIRSPMERVIGPIDEFFRTIAYRADLARSAYRFAVQTAEAEGLPETEIPRLISEFMEKPTQGAIKKADAAALYGTFQMPLGPQGQIGTAWLNSIPGGRIIVPFITTPTNIFKMAWAERSPLGLLSKRNREILAKGGPEAQLLASRMAMGSTLMGTAYFMAQNGQITGAEPSDPEAAAMLKAMGWKPYSIRIKNDDGSFRYESYHRAEPLAFLIGAVADAAQFLKWKHTFDENEYEEEEVQARKIIGALVAGIAENSMNKTFLSGVADFFEMLSDPPRRFDHWHDRNAGAMIPFSSIRRDLTKIRDPYIREAWTLADKLYRDSGLWTDDDKRKDALPPARDFLGNPRTYISGQFLGPVSIFSDSKMDLSLWQQELVSLMGTTNRVPLTRVRKIREGVKLTPHQLDRLTVLSRQEHRIDIDQSGIARNFPEAIEATMQGEVYQAMAPDGRVDLLKAVQQQFDKEAFAIMVADDEDLARAIRKRKAAMDAKTWGKEKLPLEIQQLLEE